MPTPLLVALLSVMFTSLDDSSEIPSPLDVATLSITKEYPLCCRAIPCLSLSTTVFLVISELGDFQSTIPCRLAFTSFSIMVLSSDSERCIPAESHCPLFNSTTFSLRILLCDKFRWRPYQLFSLALLSDIIQSNDESIYIPRQFVLTSFLSTSVSGDDSITIPVPMSTASLFKFAMFSATMLFGELLM